MRKRNEYDLIPVEETEYSDVSGGYRFRYVKEWNDQGKAIGTRETAVGSYVLGVICHVRGLKNPFVHEMPTHLGNKLLRLDVYVNRERWDRFSSIDKKWVIETIIVYSRMNEVKIITTEDIPMYEQEAKHRDQVIKKITAPTSSFDPYQRWRIDWVELNLVGNDLSTGGWEHDPTVGAFVENDLGVACYRRVAPGYIPPRDKTIICQVCRRSFAFPVSEQKVYYERKYADPHLCPQCRYKDKVIQCQNCHKSFVFIKDEQEFYLNQGFAEPTRCATCHPRDKVIRCKDCHKLFVFTTREQAFFLQRGYTEPKRCRTCRDRRKTM
jgi:hypothetical protein